MTLQTVHQFGMMSADEYSVDIAHNASGSVHRLYSGVAGPFAFLEYRQDA